MSPTCSGIFSIFVLFYSVFLHAPVFAQNSFDNIAIILQPVSGTVRMLTTQDINAAVSVGNYGVLMVDDQCSPRVDRITAALREPGGDASSSLLHTSFHGDHFFDGNPLAGHTGGAAEQARRSRGFSPVLAWVTTTHTRPFE